MPRKANLHAYTERAIRATEAGKLIPPIVYLPRLLRNMPVQVSIDNMALNMEGPKIEENLVRITAADPVGFLVAIMHGQPIPEFRVTRTGNIEMFYGVPPLNTRVQAAQYLAHKVTIRRREKSKGGDEDRHSEEDYQALIARAGGSLNQSIPPDEDERD